MCKIQNVKKSVSFFLSLLLIFLTTSCSNFMKGSKILDDLQQAIAEASAPVTQVFIGVEKVEYGKVIPSDLRDFIVNKEYQIEFIASEKVRFDGWEVSCKDKSVPPEKLAKFENPKSPETKVTILSNKKGIQITPKVTEYPYVVSINPVFSYSGAPFDSDIVIEFNKPINPESVFTKKEIEYEGFKYMKYTNHYYIQDIEDGNEYQINDGDGTRNSFYLEPYFKKNDDGTCDYKTLIIPSEKDKQSSYLAKRSVIVNLSNTVEDKDGLSLEKNYPNGYSYELHFSEEREKLRNEFKGLKIYSNYTSDKETTIPVYERKFTANSQSLSFEEIYGDHFFENLQNSLFMFHEHSSSINSEYYGAPYFGISTTVDPRVTWSITVLSKKASIEETRIEDFDEDAPLSDYYGFSVFENCFEDTSSVSEKLFIPHDFNSTIQGVGNAFERLFDGDGIYQLYFILKDSFGNICDTYYEAFVIYRQNFEEHISDLQIRYDGTNLTYNNDKYQIASVDITPVEKLEEENPKELKRYTDILQATIEKNYLVIKNNVEDRKYPLQNLLPNGKPEVILSRKDPVSGSVEVLLHSEPPEEISLTYSLRDCFPDYQIKYTTSTASDAEYTDTIIIPESELKEGKKNKNISCFNFFKG